MRKYTLYVKISFLQVIIYSLIMNFNAILLAANCTSIHCRLTLIESADVAIIPMSEIKFAIANGIQL